MRKLAVFQQVSVDGYFVDRNGDEYQIVVNPIALGERRTMFDNIKEKFSLKLTKSRTFRDGRVFLCYQPAK